MTAYWHGGAPGLAPGDWLQPRTVTGILRPYDVLGDLYAAGKGGWLAQAGRGTLGTPERVYVTASLACAREYAQGYSAWLASIGAPGAGCIYRAEPVDPLPDPNMTKSYTTERAIVTAVEEADVPANDSTLGRMAIREMRDCYVQWRDELNDGADRWPCAPGESEAT